MHVDVRLLYFDRVTHQVLIFFVNHQFGHGTATHHYTDDIIDKASGVPQDIHITKLDIALGRSIRL